MGVYKNKDVGEGGRKEMGLGSKVASANAITSCIQGDVCEDIIKSKVPERDG